MLYSQTKKDVMCLKKHLFKKEFYQQHSQGRFQPGKFQPFGAAKPFWKSQNNTIITPWQCLGPEGGMVSDMVLHPTDPSIIYIASATYPGMIYKSKDAGQSWSYVGKVNLAVNALAINQKNPTLLYAAGADRVFYKSYNGGVNWSGYEFSSYADWIYSLVVHPTNSNIIYAGADHWDGSNNFTMAVMKSTDGGRNWQAKSLGTDYGAAYAVVIDPQHPDTLYVGGYSGSSPKVFRTYDGGKNWTEISSGLLGNYVNSLTLHPGTTNVVFAGTDFRLYKSINSGDLWSFNGDFPTYDLAIDPNSVNIMYAASAGEIYKSIDGGLNWKPTSSGTNLASISAVLIDPTNGNNVYAGGQLGIFKSIKGGADWVSSNSGFIAAVVTELQIPQAAPNILYIAIANDALYKSEDKGLSWTRLQEFEGCDGVIDLAVAPTNPDLVLVLSGG
jgi:photosystem II stability/assembly factor-like uncharacterized protein